MQFDEVLKIMGALYIEMMLERKQKNLLLQKLAELEAEKHIEEE